MGREIPSPRLDAPPAPGSKGGLPPAPTDLTRRGEDRAGMLPLNGISAFTALLSGAPISPTDSARDGVIRGATFPGGEQPLALGTPYRKGQEQVTLVALAADPPSDASQGDPDQSGRGDAPQGAHPGDPHPGGMGSGHGGGNIENTGLADPGDDNERSQPETAGKNELFLPAARAGARVFIEGEDKIFASVREKFPDSMSGEANPLLGTIIYNEAGLLIRVYDPDDLSIELQRLGIRYFTKLENNKVTRNDINPSSIPFIPGFPYRLDVNGCMDPELTASDAYKAYIESTNIPIIATSYDFKTAYYFNAAGEFLKVLQVPPIFAEGRDDIITRDRFGIKVSYPSPMLPKDFEFVGDALEKIQQRLDEIE